MSTESKTDSSQAAGAGPDPVPGKSTPESAKKPQGRDKTTQKPAPSAAQGGRRGGGAAGPLAVLALVIALAAGAGVWWLSQQLDQTRQSLADSRADLERRLAAVPGEIGGLSARIDGLAADLGAIGPQVEAGLRAEIEQLDQRIAALHQALQKTMAPMHEPADIEHLLLIANDSLTLQGDITTALAALQAADARLRATSDPLFADTRRLLAREIAALQAAPRPDIPGMAFAISGLQAEIEALDLQALRAPGGERVAPSWSGLEAEGEGEGMAGWRTLIGDLWTALGKLVVIRRSDELEGPLLGPEQRVYLTQNLWLKLESARLALLSRDEANFRHHLEVVREWLLRYYDDGHSAVAAIIAQLDALAAGDIRPQHPDISASLQALREALDRRRTPVVDTPAAGQAS